MADVRIDFVVSGHDQLLRLFEGIEQRATRAAKASRATGQAAKRSSAEGAKAGNKWLAAEQRLARRKLQARQRAAQAAARANAAEVRAAERKVAKIERLENRLHAKLARQREKRVQQEKRAQDRIAADQRRSYAARHARYGREALGGGIRAAGAFMAAASGVGGAAARQSLSLQDLSTKIAVQARDAGKVGATPTALRTGFEGAAAGVPGATAAGVAEAVQAFVTKTGDLETALAMQKDIATAMVATGTEGQYLGRAMADLMEKFDVSTVDGMRDAMASLIFQGKQGSFELEDMAEHFAKIGAAAERFGGMRGAQGVKVVGGLAQISKRYVGTGEQAATTFENLFKELISKSDVIERGARVGGKRVKVFKDKGKTQTRDIQDVLVETIAGFKGNLQKLSSVFGARGVRGVTGLIAEFNRVKDAAPGTEAEKIAAGMEAMRKMLRKNIEAGGTWAEVQKDAATMGKTFSNSMSASWEKVVRAVGAEATPAILNAVKQLGQLEKETGVLTKAGSGLGTALVALAEAVEIVTDGLVALGLIDPKDKKAEEQLQATRQMREGRAAIDRMGLSDKAKQSMDLIMAGAHGKGGKRGFTKGEEIRAAVGQGFSARQFMDYRRAKRQIGGAMDVMFEDVAPQPTAKGAREQFLEQYAAAHGGGWYGKRAAKGMAGKIEDDPMAPEASEGLIKAGILGAILPGMGALAGGAIPDYQNEQAKQAMQQYAEQVIAQGDKMKEARMAEAAKENAEAAKENAEAMRAATEAAKSFAKYAIPGGHVFASE